MPEVAAPEAPAAPLTHSEKVKAGLARKDAMKAALLAKPAASAPVEAPKADAPPAGPPTDFASFAPPLPAALKIEPGFMSWQEFMEKACVAMAMSDRYYTHLGKFSNRASIEDALGEAAKNPLFAILRGAYMAGKSIYSLGVAEFGKE